jgi:hypothetical protein
MQWIAKEFDFISGKYTGDYYDLSTINWFVDSDLGSDSTGNGSATDPWKTIGKLISTASVITGHRVMINGIFTENTTITKGLRIIGCGGGRSGRAVFNNGGSTNFIKYSISGITIENIETTNYSGANLVLQTGLILIFNSFSNCIFNFTGFNINGSNSINHTVYFTIFRNCTFVNGVTPNRTHRIFGSNNTFFDCNLTSFSFVITLSANNTHINNNLMNISNLGSNNIINVNGQYYNPTLNDFNFLSTSPLYQTGTLDGTTGVINNVGAGKLGEFYNATSFEYTAPGGASFSNTEVSGTGIYRTDDTSPGSFESGVIQLNNGRRRGVVIGIHNSFNFSGGKLTELIQESSGLTVRQGLDCELIIGNSLNEVNAKLIANDWLLYEYGKLVTITVVGSSTYGNADPFFDPTDFIVPAFEYFKIRFRFKDA